VPSKPSAEELRERIQADIRFYGGVLSERATLVWDGYLAALLEWGLISVSLHCELIDMYPRLENNPVDGILRGRGDI
jgi:hypothetical protein